MGNHDKNVATLDVTELRSEVLNTKILDSSDLNDADRDLAGKFGYKPVLKREFDFLSTFSFAVSISSLFSTITLTFSYGLVAAGPASVIWCWLISGAGCLCIALSVAELVSAYPTSGGMYYTVSRLAPQSWVPSISWVVGWLNILGQTAGIASSEFGSAQMILAAVSIGSDFTYVPTINATVGVMAGLLVVNGLVNSLPTLWLGKLTKTYVVFHIIVLISCSIALLAKTMPKNDAAYVFTHVDEQSLSGWTPVGFSFLFACLSVSYTMTGYDDTAHICEEVKNPEITAPRAISAAMIFTYVGGFLFNIVLCFCMGDPASILASPIAQPVAQIYYNSLGKSGGIFFTVCAIVILQFGCINGTQSLGRSFFAFSRDRLLPGSRIWTKINSTTKTPLYAVWISVVFCIVINLIALGSLTAILGVFSVCAIALDWSYCIPILCKLIFASNGGRLNSQNNTNKNSMPTFTPGPWNLGRYSTAINIWAVVWTLFSSVIFVLPIVRPVTPTNMNYASVYLVGILFAAAVYWYGGARKWYTGPIVEVEIESDVVPGIGDATVNINSARRISMR